MVSSLRMSLWLGLGCLALLTRCTHAGPPAGSREGEVVSTASGPVRGLVLADGTHAFLGIPYAAPPTGARRWRPPEPPAAWTEPFVANRLGLPCPQAQLFGNGKVEASEDCLHLNVWTPAVAPGARRPVMVFLHGGAFTMGSNSMELYDGAALTRSGVVVVTPNYRLGALGFLAHPALAAEDPAHPVSGNYGVMDQRLALQWVHDNIARFGGDPENVTLFGESAGAISTCLHMVSPASSGLFQRLITESGTCHLVTVPGRDPGTPAEDSAEERGLRLAREVGCGEGDVLACLRGKTPDELLAASGSPMDLMRPHVPFGPSVDGEVLPAPPAQLLKEGRYTKVPMLVGTNEDEGSLFTFRAKLDTPEQYEAAVKVRSPDKADALLKLYPVKEHTSPKAAYNHMLRDALFLCPTRELARTVTAHGQPVYLYQFTYAPSRTFNAFMGITGAFHAAELPFVFGATQGGLRLEGEREHVLSRHIMGYWTRFATKGDPNGEGAMAWPLFTPEAEPHLVLGEKLSVGEHLDQAHCDALNTLR